MVSVKPFAAWRPTTNKAGDIASPPYDVVDEDEARAFAAARPDSFMKVIRPEVNLPAGSTAEQQHAEARRRFQAFCDSGLLERDKAPRIYFYRQSRGQHVQTGIMALCSVQDYEDGRIKKHEHVRPAKVKDRTDHFLSVGAQTGPIFLSARDDAGLTKLLERGIQGEKTADFIDDQSVRHEVFFLPADGSLVKTFAAIDSLYIADGHHRTASACNVRAHRKAQGTLKADDPSQHFMAVIFPASHLKILAYNRLVRDLGAYDGPGLLAAIASRAPVRAVPSGVDPRPAKRGVVAICVGQGWNHIDLTPLIKPGSSPEEQLDAHLLQTHVLAPLLGIEDPRTDARIDFWGGHRGPDELARQVALGKAGAVFFMHPVSMSEIMDVADAGKVMPPKSTWFDPKLRSGLFVYDLSQS